MSAISHSSTPWTNPPPTYDGSTTTLTPYLQLSHLLSLTWLAYPILSLLFVVFRLQLSLASSQDAVSNAKDNLLRSCKAAEEAATSAASMPRFMARAANEQFVDAVNGTLRGAQAALVLSLTAMEAIINFIIDLYRSTLLCFLELVVRGGLSILIGAVQEVNTLLQNVTASLRTSIQNDIQSANNVIKSFVDTVNKINPFNDITAPQINVPSLDGLTNIQLPPSFQDTLTKLNASLPTVADLKDKIESIIDTPFELVKKEINDTFAEISFNSSGMPLPQRNTITFCDDMDLSVVDDLGQDLIKIAKIGTAILIILALLLVGLNCALTWYKWRCMKNHLEYTRQAWLTDPTMYHTKGATGVPQMTLTDHNLLMLQASSSHPLLTKIANRLSQLLRLKPSQHTHLQWFFNYIFHPPAVAIFLIGFFGLLCVQIELFAMGPLISKYQDRAAGAVSDFSNTIATSINNSMYNQSAAYASEVNSRVDAAQTTLNDGLFGWVNGTTTTLNTTINQFYTDVENAVNSVFGGTILEAPAQDFIRCLIGTKIDAIENALTFLHDNLKIDMPRMNQSALVLPPDSVNEVTAPIAAAAIGGGENDDQGLIGRLVESYASSLKKERIMFSIFLGLWGIVVLMGIAVVLWHSYGVGWMEKRRRGRWMNERNAGIDGLVVPFRDSENGKSLDSSAPATWNVMRSISPTEVKVESKEVPTQDHEGNQPNQPAEGRKGFMAAAKARFTLGKTSSSDEEERYAARPSRMTALFRKGDNTSEEKNPWTPELQYDNGILNTPRETISDGQGLSSKSPKSRWSQSPTATKTAPWAGILSPGKKSVALPPSPSVKSKETFGSSTPTRSPVSPPRPLRSKHIREPSVPSDVDLVHGDETYGGVTVTDPIQSSQTLFQPLVPIPLHHGFEGSSSRYPIPSASRRYHQAPVSPSATATFSAQLHRRSTSVPVINELDNMAGVGARRNAAGRRLLPYNRDSNSKEYLSHSPFADEHRVRIDQPAVTRKSMATNPFEPEAL